MNDATASRRSGVYFLGAGDARAVERLRFADLIQGGGFEAAPAAVEWSKSDDSSRVFGIYGGIHESKGALLASLRAELPLRPEDLPPKLDYDRLHEVVSLPCGLIGKAVTRADCRGRGFNTYLQYLAYRYFHGLGIRHIVGTIMPTAPYVGLFRELGFQFIENPEGWRRYGYQSFGMTYVIHLDLERNYEHVMSVLRPKVAGLIREYPVRPRGEIVPVSGSLLRAVCAR